MALLDQYPYMSFEGMAYHNILDKVSASILWLMAYPKAVDVDRWRFQIRF